MPWISYLFLLSVTVLLPLALVSYLGLFNRPLFKPFFFGVLAFVISQVLLRIPILQYGLSPQIWFITFSYAYPILFVFLLSLSAGVFEEIARYLIMKKFLKSMTKKHAVLFGLGHGGIEAFLLVGIPAILNISQFLTVDVVYAGIERISAIMIHCALSIMVFKAVSYKSTNYLFVAILVHTLFNFLAIIALRQGMSLWMLEGMLFVGALSALLIQVKERIHV